MARSVSVFLRANVTGFVSGMRSAAGSVNSLERTLHTSTGRQREALDRVGRGATIAAVGMVAGFGLAVKASMDFDRQMSAVKANAGATAAELSQMRKAALEAGTSTAFSATQAAKAEEELAKAGVSAKDVIGGGLKGALDLASAGQLEVGESAEIAATAMTQFGLSGKDVPHIADLLSAAANKAQGSVHDLGFAMKMGGLVANQFGLSVEETTGTLAAYASQGLIGSDAGTSFKTMLLHLAAPTHKASGLMQELGINTYDASGKFIGITGLANQLQTKLGGLTEAQRNQALATIFGTDAIRGANILYKQGSAGIQSWIDKTNDAGNASRTAATKLDNLSGDLTKLKGAFTTALIGAGDGAKGPLRELVSNVTGVVNAFNSMPAAAQSATIWVAGITGAALLGAKGLVFMVRSIKDTRIALEALGLTGARVGAAMGGLRSALSSTAGFLAGPWGIALALGIGALALWASSKKEATKATAEFTNAIQQDSGALGANTRAAVNAKLEQLGLLESAKKLGVGLPTLTDAVLGNKNAYQQVIAQLDAYILAATAAAAKGEGQVGPAQEAAQAAAKQAKEAKDLKKALQDQNGAVKASSDSVARQTEANKAGATAQGQAATAAGVHAEAEDSLSKAMSDATQTAEQLQKALDDLSKANMDADRAAIEQRKSALEAAKASDHRRGVSDKEKTALLDLADSNHKTIAAMKADGATGDELKAKQQKLAEQFIKTAIHMGASRKEATDLAKRYAQLTPVTADAAAALGGYISKVQSAAGAQSRLSYSTGHDAVAAHKAYTDRVQDSLPVLYALAGKNQAARAQVDALARASGNAAGVQLTSRSAFLKNAAAMGVAKDKAAALWTTINKIKPKLAKVTVDAQGHWSIPGGGKPATTAGLATGGPVPRLGPESTRAHDSVPAMLRVDEHVWTPEEVDAVGGHAAMYRIRRMALAGHLQGYATGGKVELTGGGSTGAAVDTVMAPIRSGYADMLASMAKVFAAQWKKYMGNGGPIVAAARSQIGLPYSWGGGGTGGPSYGIGRGAGTYGYDCSGLTEYAWWKGRHKDIGGSTGPQAAGSTSIGGPRPGALAFVGNPIHHVMLGSSKPGYVIQAPHTGAFVEEVPRSSSNWRWPSGLASGGEVKLGERVSSGRASRDDAMLAKVLQLAGSGPRGSERHTAQIAQGGDMRLWAEPETGGEAYIPLASSKRNRSKQILAAVARTFGMSVRGMADGGITSYADGGTSDLNLSDYLSKYDDTHPTSSKADVTSAQKARRTQLDQLKNAEEALAKARHKHHKDWAQIRKDERKVAAERRDVADATKKLHTVESQYAASKQSSATKLGASLGLGIKNTGAFIANLTKLADRGFGTLAQQLLAMGGTEAEKIAADAVKFSDSKLKTLQGQVVTAQQQQSTLANMDSVLAVRSAIKGGKGGSWISLLNATGLDPGTLSTAVHLMAGDLSKTAGGKALLADMKKHGYVQGGWISGVPGTDTNLVGATDGEFMVRARQAGKYGPLVEAINNDRVGDALLRRYISGGQAGTRATRGSDGSSAPAINQTFNHPEMNASQLAREAAREAAWMLSA